MEVKDSALKHGVRPEDIRHALVNVITVHFFDDYRMVVGPTRDGSLLEVAVNRSSEVFHAMPVRPKFLRRK